MKKRFNFFTAAFLLLAFIHAPIIHAGDYDWLTNYDWYLEMSDGKKFIYWHKSPWAVFKINDIPKDSAIYRRVFRTKFFTYLYPVGKDRIVAVGYNQYTKGEDEMLFLAASPDFSEMFIINPRGLFLGGGKRMTGTNYDPEHPYLGMWMTGDKLNEEVCMVDPGDYQYYFEIKDDIPGFAIYPGGYLLKPVGKDIFESDSTFPEGHIRLEIKSPELIVLTPLYKLPKKDGRTEPLPLRRTPKGSRENAKN